MTWRLSSIAQHVFFTVPLSTTKLQIIKLRKPPDFFPDEPTARILYKVRLCLKCLFCCSSPAPYAPNSIILVVSSLGMASKVNFYLPTGLAQGKCVPAFVYTHLMNYSRCFPMSSKFSTLGQKDWRSCIIVSDHAITLKSRLRS